MLACGAPISQRPHETAAEVAEYGTPYRHRRRHVHRAQTDGLDESGANRLYLGIADGMFDSAGMGVPVLKMTALDMPSAMPI